MGSWGQGGNFFKEKGRLQLPCPWAHPQPVLGQSLAELLGGCSPSAAAKSSCAHGNDPTFLTFPWIFSTLGLGRAGCAPWLWVQKEGHSLDVCRSFWAGRGKIGASHLVGKILPSESWEDLERQEQGEAERRKNSFPSSPPGLHLLLERLHLLGAAGRDPHRAGSARPHPPGAAVPAQEEAAGEEGQGPA